jgi:predicted 2-oxoglutarate/Fe(II)-dependent dioxygenase YbiX
MLNAAKDEGTIVGETREEAGVVDESIRRVLSARVPTVTKLLVRSHLEQLKPRLEEHFQVRVSGRDGPHFLIYGPGTFYKWHQDASPDAPPHIRQRRVSVVIFLNAPDDAVEDGYRGGALTFYGLLHGPVWEECAFSLEPARGLLIAFRPSVFHEVEPVTSGQRFTIVAWFTDPTSPDS